MKSQIKRHPILTEEWIRSDGTRQEESRVYCDVRGRSVSPRVCEECEFCVAVEGREIRCSPATELLPTTALSTGAALRHGVTIVDESVFVRDVVALFVEKRLRMLVVADASGRAQGVVHESRVVREILDITHAGPHPRCLGWDATTIEPASSVTSTPVTVLESTPLRDALLRMATAHQRQVLVVDEQGFPVGLLLDVDAMHDLRRAETPDDDEP